MFRHHQWAGPGRNCFHCPKALCGFSIDVTSNGIWWRIALYNAHIHASFRRCAVSCGSGSWFVIAVSYRIVDTKFRGGNKFKHLNGTFCNLRSAANLPQMFFQQCVSPCGRHACCWFCTIYCIRCIETDAHFYAHQNRERKTNWSNLNLNCVEQSLPFAAIGSNLRVRSHVDGEFTLLFECFVAHFALEFFLFEGPLMGDQRLFREEFFV